MVISAKARLVSIIVAVVFMFGALAGTGAYLIVNHINNANATTETTLSITANNGNLYNTDGSINGSAAAEFLNKLDFISDGAEYKSPEIADEAGVSTNSFIFQMGYVVSSINGSMTTRPITWQAVYARNGYLTIWMTQNYTISYFNTSSSSVNSTDSPFAGYTTRPSTHGYNHSYAYSILRDSTINIYEELEKNLDSFSSIIVMPTTANTGYDWQTTQNNTGYSATNGLGSQTSTTNPFGVSWTSRMSDKFWIPSYYETFNNSSSGYTFDGGLWDLSATDVSYSTVRLDTNSTTTNYSDYFWLRSGNSSDNYFAMRVESSDSAGGFSVSNSYGVRPAAHLSLLSLASAASYTITAQSNNTTYGTVSGGGIYNLNYVGTTTITATPNYGYVFDRWQDSAGNKFYSNPYTFTVTQSETYTAYFREPNITITSANNGSEIAITNSDIANVSITYGLTFTANNYIIGLTINGGVYQPIEYLSGDLIVDDSCTAITYRTNSTGSQLILEIYQIADDITITLSFANVTQTFTPASGGANIDGVALQVSANGDSADLIAVGEARITGYSQTDGLTTVHVSAWASTGFRFVGWQVDGETISTLLSADIPYDDVEGKILVAVFEPINANMNNETDNNQTNDFV